MYKRQSLGDSPKIREAVQNALTYLSGIQTENGDFTAWNTVNSMSAAQVILALVQHQMDPRITPDFIKNNTSVYDSCLLYTSRCV